MKWLFFVVCLVAFVSLHQPASGQLSPWENQGWGSEEPYGMLYDPTTQMVVTGRIMGIEEAMPGRGAGPALFMHLRTDEGLMVPVLLGPRWYVLSQHVPLNVGNPAQVVGSRVMLSSTAVIIASWVQSGNQFLVLRDDLGYPVWDQW